MQEKDIKDIQNTDMDIIENAVVAFRELWNKKLLILLVTIAGLLCSLIFITVRGDSKRYHSSATLFSAVYGATADSSEGVIVMNRYADMISSSRVCSRAAQALTAYNITTEELQGMVAAGMITVSGASTNSMSYGYKLTLDVFNDSAAEILPVTNAMASAFTAELNDLVGTSSIQVMDEATSYNSFDTLNKKLYILAITGGAFIFVCGIIFLLAFFSPWVKSVAQCEHDNELVLGLLPYVKK